MTQDSIPPLSDPTDAPPPRAQISELVSDVRLLAESEWEYAKARLSYSGGVVRKAGVYALAAILALSAAAIALVLGILLILSAYWGPWIATAAVVTIMTLIAVISALLARKTARNLSFAKDEIND